MATPGAATAMTVIRGFEGPQLMLAWTPPGDGLADRIRIVRRVDAWPENIDNGVNIFEEDAYTEDPDPVYVDWSDEDALFDAGQWILSPGALQEVWTVEFVTMTTFTVTGATSGLQGTGTLGVLFTTTNTHVTFLLTGVPAMPIGNTATFEVFPFPTSSFSDRNVTEFTVHYYKVFSRLAADSTWVENFAAKDYDFALTTGYFETKLWNLLPGIYHSRDGGD